MTGIKRITTRDDLTALANQLGMREDWHEPGELEVTAKVSGTDFDNAGNWGAAELARVISARPGKPRSLEMWVTLLHEGIPVAEVSLADLFTFATGFTG